MTKEVTLDEMLTCISKPNHILIDVREYDELLETGYIPTARHYPMSNFDSALSSMESDKTYYIICRAAGRSAKVQHFLLEHGFNAINVAGGMDAYTGPVNYLK